MRRQGPMWARGSPRVDPERSRHDIEQLVTAIGSEYLKPSVIDWDHVRRSLGVALPFDYRIFVESFGHGKVCDIRISGPGQRDGADLSRLLRRTCDQAKGSRKVPESVPFYPEQNGIIAWGESSDGWVFGWGSNRYEPDRWGVIAVELFPSLSQVADFPDLSFASFLLQYSGQQGDPDMFLDRKPWRRGLRFAP